MLLLATGDFVQMFRIHRVSAAVHVIGLIQFSICNPKKTTKPTAEPGMHLAAERPASENRREPAEQPRQINPEAGEQREKKEERNHPMQKARVHAVPLQLANVNFVLPDLVEGGTRFVVETVNGARHQTPSFFSGGSGCGRRGPTVT